MRRIPFLPVVALACIALLQTAPAGAATLKILLPLGRVAYQTNEWIDFSVVRSDPGTLRDGTLLLTLTGDDGSKLGFTFATKGAVPITAGALALATEHLHVNGSLLRPGNYTVDVAADGATTPPVKIEVYSYIRHSNFKLIDWGSRAVGTDQAVLGEESVGLNLNLATYGGLSPDDLIRGGLDYMWCCTMSGGSQMDLRRECDWSDPYVLGGGVARVARRAFMDRVNPNCLGVHIYDEPTLTVWKDPATGDTTPFNVPAQDRSYTAAFGKAPIQYNEVKPDNPEDVAQWDQMQRWRMTLLDAAWKLSADSVSDVESRFFSANQGDWLFSGYGQGYYFNYMNSLPVYSGHGGYDYLNGGDFAPGYFFEFGRIRQVGKPNWYLPTWSIAHGDLFRAEQYLAFQNNIQGMDKPPDQTVHRPSTSAVSGAVVESNKAMARLGTIFTTMPVTPPDVAVLYSLSHNLNAEVHDMKDTYVGDGQLYKLLYIYMASKILHTPFYPVVEEDILDGSLAAHHKVLVIAGNNYLQPKVVDALESFIGNGGVVLLSDDSKVEIKGAKRFKYPQTGVDLNTNMAKWGSSGQWDKWNFSVVSNAFFKAALPVAEAMRPALEAAGVKPVFGCDQPGVVASRQAQGDIEYLFAVNASPDYDTYGWYDLHNAVANITLPGDGRPVYDAMNGRLATEFQKNGGNVGGKFRFGPGQMRVWARTARPIGGVQILTPAVSSDFTAAKDPIHVDVNAVIVDNQGQVLTGAAPMQIQMIDPLGVTRYDLYRSTDNGMLHLSLPLAVNDPGGRWTVVVHELLSNTSKRASFQYIPAAQPGAMAGATRRAVYFAPDWQNIFRFFRRHRNVAIVAGTSPYDAAQAQRLVDILKPWDIQCTIVPLAEASKARELTPEMAKTWVGLGGREPDFALSQPAILLGTPEDNTLIKFLQDQHYLPYQPVRDQFPGAGRGMMAWQENGIRYFNAESITLIGYDAAGLAEAVGNMYEAMAGQDPITPLVLPARATSTPATRDPSHLTPLGTAWQLALPDRIAAARPLTGGDVVVLTEDGTLSRVRSDGKLAWQRSFDGGEQWALDATPDGSTVALGSSHHLFALDASGATRFDLPFTTESSAPWITFVAVSSDGKRIAVGGGISDALDPKGWTWHGKLMMVSPTGKVLWEIAGPGAGASPALPLELMSAGLFSADGTKLILPLSKDTRVLDATTGELITTQKAATGAVPAVWQAGSVVLSDGANKLVSFQPGVESGGTVWPVTLPGGAKIVTLARIGDRMIVGSEGDGSVRQFTLGATGLEARPDWEFTMPTRIVKKVAISKGLVAVAYWGGSLRVLDDTNGKVVYGQAFPQDICSMDWVGGRLIVGLADGRIVALAAGQRE